MLVKSPVQEPNPVLLQAIRTFAADAGGHSVSSSYVTIRLLRDELLVGRGARRQTSEQTLRVRLDCLHFSTEELRQTMYV